MSSLREAARIGLVSGSIGSVANSLAIESTKALGLKPGTGGLARLVFGRPLGKRDAELFHLAMGIGMATAYAYAFRDRLRGPGWLRGLAFAQIPGTLQLFWVLPASGHGPGGIRLSRATPLLAWSLNALYGIVVGTVAART